MNNKNALVLTMILLMVFFLVFGPIFTIWSLNALFDLNISVTLRTWAAVMWILMALHGFRFAVRNDPDE